MLAAEGQMHKRQRRVATPAFSIQNMRALVPIVFQKGAELGERWEEILSEDSKDEVTIDVCHWVSRATFDVIGLTGEPDMSRARFIAHPYHAQALTITLMRYGMSPTSFSWHTRKCSK